MDWNQVIVVAIIAIVILVVVVGTPNLRQIVVRVFNIFEMKVTNQKPTNQAEPDLNVEGIKSRKGGLLVEEEAGGKTNLKDVEVEDDVLVSRRGNPPKA